MHFMPAILVTFLLASASLLAADKDAQGPLVITKEADGKTVTMAQGKAALIALKGNPTTGYLWTVASIDGKAVSQNGDVQYVPDKAKPGSVGTGGTFQLQLVARQKGKATITMHYKRPFEKDKPPVETFKVTIEVN